MTQEVQPLTWQKRTNIEEHQQFFSKINEIIDNLAPTVDEAEAAIAQATAAIASANDAIATANAASAAASAAASQAQTAASTVAGYETRLGQVENKTSANQANISSLSMIVDQNGDDIAALQGVQADYVKKAGAAQTVTSQIMVPTTATGIRDTQIANGTRIQNDLDNYPGMIRTTGNQTKAGGLTVYGSSSGSPNIDNANIYLKNRWSDITQNTSYNTTSPMISFIDNANHVAAFIYVAYNVDHTATLVFRVRNSDGSYKTVFEQKGDVIA